ncbi:ead/Ea22-like family protein [Escherichia coli]
MSNIDKQALREAAEKATKGEWWSDVVETDGEYGEGEDRVSGYHSYAVYVGHESLLDMTNSTAACIHTEWDHDYQMAWDETAKRNAEFIAAANPATVLALLDELEAKDKQIDDLKATASHSNAGWKEAHEQEAHAEAAEKRIAELELREVVLPQCYSMLHRVDFDEPYHTEMVYRQHQVLEALHNAGINVTEAGKGEAS